MKTFTAFHKKVQASRTIRAKNIEDARKRNPGFIDWREV